MTVKIENLQNLEQVDVVELTDEEMQTICGGVGFNVNASVKPYDLDELLDLIGGNVDDPEDAPVNANVEVY